MITGYSEKRKLMFPDIELVVIGVSAGGIEMLNKIVPSFKMNGKIKVAIVIHMPPSGPNLIPSLMKDITPLTVKEADAGESLSPDHIYIAPPDYHLCIEPGGTISLSSEEPVNFSRPSIDILFESAAYAFGNKTLGILLTGANNDGALGLKKIQELGGKTIVQDPKDAQFNEMPKSALAIMKPDYVLTSGDISEFIATLSRPRT